MTAQSFPFPHAKLDAFQVSLQLARAAKKLADQVPRGSRSFADHLVRAAGATTLLLGEGANRFGRGAKRQRYSEARGECGEVAAAVELLCVLELVDTTEAGQVLLLAGRVGAMLTRLIQRCR